MKALTALPTQAYVQVGEETRVPLQDLLRLVQELETNVSPAYVARYRPDVAAGLDAESIRRIEARLRSFLDLADRRVTILTAINQQERLTPELRARIESSMDRRELEDLYLPYKPKRRTSADEALDKGLEDLARSLWSQDPPDGDPLELAAAFVKSEGETAEAALAGARAIVARWLGENAEIRRDLRRIAQSEARLRVEAVAAERRVSGRDEALRKRFLAMDGYTAPVSRAPWRQVLSIRRGVREGWLRLHIELPESNSVRYLEARLVKQADSKFAQHLKLAAEEAYRSYLAHTLEGELRQELDERCDAEAIEVYQRNLRKALAAPPFGPRPAIGLETSRPGGWRAAAIGPDGSLLEAAIVRADPDRPAASAETASHGPSDDDASTAGEGEAILPPVAAAIEPASAASAEAVEAAAVPPADTAARAIEPSAEAPGEVPSEVPVEPAAQPPASLEAAPEGAEAADESVEPDRERERIETPAGDLAEMIARHNAELIVFGNGPGLRQVERFVRAAVKRSGRQAAWMATSDAGSWIYATSKAARREFSDQEPAVRSAVSLARRVQNPLAELIKLDPRVLGIGQGHHEVDQKKLRTALREAQEAAAQEVGVDVNTAPAELLALVPGMTERVARRIVEHRKQHGPFASLRALSEMPGLNARVYEQAAGFLRVYGGEEPFDETGVHPRDYPRARKLLAAAGLDVRRALADPAPLLALDFEALADKDASAAVLRAIAEEFRPERRGPRGAFEPPKPAVEVEPLDEVKPGLKVEGVVANVADFGVFVDIGAEQDGLVHFSQLAPGIVREGEGAIKVGDRLTVYVIHVAPDGKRISLSMREPREPRESSRQRRVAPENRRPGADGGRGDRPRGPRPDRDDRKPMRRTFGPDERQDDARLKSMSVSEKLAALQDKFRTKV